MKNLAVFLVIIVLVIIVGLGYIGGARLAGTNTETVYVKYRGPVDLSPFGCEWITRSSFVQRLCYDASEQYVIVNLRGTYYHYCEVPASVVAAWRNAESIGGFYNASVKGRFDCRVLRVPSYEH